MSEPTSDVTNTACELMSEARLEHFEQYAPRSLREAKGGPELIAALRAERTARLKAEAERDLLRDVARAAEMLVAIIETGMAGEVASAQMPVRIALDRAKKGGAL